jgi:hypothetical protein
VEPQEVYLEVVVRQVLYSQEVSLDTQRLMSFLPMRVLIARRAKEILQSQVVHQVTAETREVVDPDLSQEVREAQELLQPPALEVLPLVRLSVDSSDLAPAS